MNEYVISKEWGSCRWQLKKIKVIITILLVPIGIIIGAFVGGLIGAVIGMNMYNLCSNCDDLVVHGFRGYESLGYLGSIIGVVFGLIISLIILIYRRKRKAH